LNPLAIVWSVGHGKCAVWGHVERSRLDDASLLLANLNDPTCFLGPRIDSIDRMVATIEHIRIAVAGPLKCDRLRKRRCNVSGQAAACQKDVDAMLS